MLIPTLRVYAQLKKLRDGIAVIDNFQEDTVGHLPYYWYNEEGTDMVSDIHNRKLRDEYQYSIEEQNGNKYLHYEGKIARHLNFLLYNKSKRLINLRKRPVLSWKWRIHKIPFGADENIPDKNDVAASLYVVFRVNILGIPQTIRYTWSSTLPVGTVLSKNFGHMKIVVLASGNKRLNKWITFKRNLVHDYKRFFRSRPPKHLIAILLLSAGDSTNQLVSADYDDLELEPNIRKFHCQFHSG